MLDLGWKSPAADSHWSICWSPAGLKLAFPAFFGG